MARHTTTDACLIMHALDSLADGTDNEILAEHARSVAVDVGRDVGIDPEDATDELDYVVDA